MKYTSIKSVVKRGFRYVVKGVPDKKNVVVNISYISPSERLKGKNIIVTGGSRGLGLAMAKRFVLEKANVLITGRIEREGKRNRVSLFIVRCSRCQIF